MAGYSDEPLIVTLLAVPKGVTVSEEVCIAASLQNYPHQTFQEMCHQFLSLEQEAENDNDRDRTLDNSNSLEDSNNGGGEEGGDSWISFDQFRRSFSSEFSQQPQDDDDVSNLIQSDETAMNRRNALLCIDEGKENKGAMAL